jgi:hypothetical protein
MGDHRPSWRSLLLFLMFVALWWFFALMPSCDLGKPKPSEQVPAQQQEGEEDKAE